MPPQRDNSFRAFYRFYLAEHACCSTRVTHFIGTAAFIILGIVAGVVWNIWIGIAGIFAAYALAWVGHFVFERNKPATFKHPLWSLAADFVMFYELLTRRRRFHEPRRCKLIAEAVERRRAA